MCTSLAPVSRRRRTRFLIVVPRMIESSTMMIFLPSMRGWTGLSFTRTPKSRIAGLG
jgi:hypothetical protein